MLIRTSIALLLLCAATERASASDWPALRGAAADGVAREAVFEAGQPIGLRVAWRRELGSGYSSASIAAQRVVTMYSDGESDHLIALDRATGHELWRVSMGPTYPGHDGSHTGPISTPTIHDGRVYALGPWGRLTAAELATGSVIWSVELTDTVGARKPFYGFSAAPVMAGGVLVVPIGAAEGGAYAGIDPETGAALWAAGEDTIENQSSVPFAVGESTLVMVAGNQKIGVLDPATGTLFWEFEHEGRGARGAESLMPVLAGDGRVFLAHKNDASRLIRIGHGGEEVTFEPVWENGAIRNSYNIPVFHEGHLYAFSSRFLTCVDAETGAAAWKSRAPGDGFLILVDGHLLIQTKDGSLHVAGATPEGYRELASVQVFEDHLAWSPPAFSGGSVFVRSLGEIARVDLVHGEPTRMAASGGDVDLAGTGFGAFLERVSAAENRRGVVEVYLAEQESLPIVEDGGLVHFVFHGEADDVALGGDMIGSRQEVPMRRVDGTDLWYHSMRLDPASRVSYVFIRDFEEIPDPRNPNRHTSTIYGRDMELTFRADQMIEMSWVALPGWNEADHLAEAPEPARGSIDTHELESEILEQPVGLSVYLPRGYDEDGDRRYPVAYVYGGRAAREIGRMHNTLDNLIGASVEAVIVVFVDVRVSSLQMGKYADLLAGEVIPFVDRTYRTRPEREHRASVGVGFPGYGALFAGFAIPEIVGRVGVISPVMLDAMREPLEEIAPHAEEHPLRIYLDWGTYDLRNPHENWDQAATMRAFDRFLRERGYRPLGGETPEGAGWLAYTSRTDDLFRTLFPTAE